MKLGSIAAPYAPLVWAALLGVLLLCAGLVLALTGPHGTPLVAPESQRSVAPSASLSIVVLGDSISRGTGDSGGGYAKRMLDRLNDRGRIATLTNLAVNGSQTKDVLTALDEPAVQAEVERATLVVFSVGGNDMSYSLQGRQGAPELAVALETATANLSDILDRLNALNPNSELRVLGLYNPLEIARGHEAEARRTLFDWNVALERVTLAYPKALFVPLADLFERHPERLASDAYHPGPSGHEAIAERVIATLAD